MSKIKAEYIDHVGIIVKDLEEAAKFLGDLLGIEFTGPTENKRLDARIMYSPGLGIELVSPLSPDGATARLLKSRGEGLMCVVFKVPDVEKAAAEWTARGIRQIQGFGVRTAIGTVIFHPKDTHGVMIELTNPGRLHPTTEPAT